MLSIWIIPEHNVRQVYCMSNRRGSLLSVVIGPGHRLANLRRIARNETIRTKCHSFLLRLHAFHVLQRNLRGTFQFRLRARVIKDQLQTEGKTSKQRPIGLNSSYWRFRLGEDRLRKQRREKQNEQDSGPKLCETV